MAQTGYTPILIYGSGTTGNQPTAGNLTNSSLGSELGINYYDGKLFYKDASNVVQVLATKGGVGTSSTTQVLFNNAGLIAGASGLVWDGTYLTANSIKDSGLTSGRVTYATTGGLLADSANMTFDGTNLAIGGYTTSTSFRPSGSTVPTNGMYLPATNSLGFATNSATALTISSTSNFGFGVSPNWDTYTSVLQVPAGGIGSYVPNLDLTITQNAYYASGWKYSGTGLANRNTAQNGEFIFSNAVTGTAGNAITWLERMRIDSSGNVGIGTSSPANALNIVKDNTAFRGQLSLQTVSSSNLNQITFYNQSTLSSQIYQDYSASGLLAIINTISAPMTFATANTERMRIDSSGNVGIGTSSPSTYGQLAVFKSSGDIESAVVTGGANYATYRLQNSNQRYSMQIRTDQSNAWVLRDETNGANRFLIAAGSSEAMRIDSSGQVGIGGTPSAWASGTQYKAIQFQDGFTVLANDNGNGTALLGSNFYASGNTIYKYINSNYATMYQQNLPSGQHRWYVAPSGTAGNTISFTQAMTLDASGNVGIGTSSPTVKFQVNNSAGGNTAIFTNATSADLAINLTAGVSLITPSTGILALGTSNTERMRIDSSGNVGIGVTPAVFNGGYKALQINTLASVSGTATSTIIGNNWYANAGASSTYLATGAATLYIQDSGIHNWYTANSGTAGTTITSLTQSLSLGKGTSLALEGATSQSGTGITFPATQSASSDANTLDDYEEGTWTPNQGAGLTVVGAFTSSGTYTKVGNLVTLYGKVNGATSVFCSANGALSTNLPFTSTASSLAIGGLINGAVTTVTDCYVAPSQATAISATTTAASTSIYFSVTYQV